MEASGGTPNTPTDIPFREDFEHNTFGQVVDKTGDWRPGATCEDEMTENSETYLNNRNTHTGYSYDADGRLLHGIGIHSLYDARGALVKRHDGSSTYRLYFVSDGNGTESKRTEELYDPEEEEWSEAESKYYIRSSVLGGNVLTEVAQDGEKTLTIVYDGSSVLARQDVDLEAETETVVWEHWDSSGNARFRTDKNGDKYWTPSEPAIELDPMGNNSNYACFPELPLRGWGSLVHERSAIQLGPSSSIAYGTICYIDGVQDSCETARRFLNSGAGVVCPDNYCGPIDYYDENGERKLTTEFKAYADGSSGWKKVRSSPSQKPSQIPKLQGPSTAAKKAAAAESEAELVGLMAMGIVDNEGGLIGHPTDQLENQTTSSATTNFPFMGQSTADKMLEDVREMATKTLAAHANCRKFVDGAYEALATVGDPLQTAHPNQNGGNAIASTQPAEGIIEFYAPFFAVGGIQITIGNTTAENLQLTDSQRRLIVYLHEISHSTWKVSHYSTKIPRRMKLSQGALNKEIYRHCIPNAKAT